MSTSTHHDEILYRQDGRLHDELRDPQNKQTNNKKSNMSTSTHHHDEILYRQDGRLHDELRDLTTKLSFCNYADGSAQVTMGFTKVIALVHGPKESSSRQLATDKDGGQLKISYNTTSFCRGKQMAESKRSHRNVEFASTLRDVFDTVLMVEQYGGSEIVVEVTVIADDGGAKSVAINAVTLALIDAGIGMREYVVSATTGVVNNKACADVCWSERKAGEFPLAVLATSEKVVYMDVNTKVSYGLYQEVMDVTIESCRKIAKQLRRASRGHSLKLLGIDV
eukprot:CAMPEP_0115014718 /NCGR_PEP_ID=MMETSP0216-20121206/26269_1 /TAXON_ID=223996 /ORGANISM="Protocruzia adherens, Strain Boccale" /LENGTH=279 /DNA_ID=CAMNT_0002384559 /DNA_START=13 /DNA_END=852 /DNA_ORIENTATION=+